MKGLIDIYKIKDLHNGMGQFSKHLYLNIIEMKRNDLELDLLIPGRPAIQLQQVPNVNYLQCNFRRRYFPSFNQNYDFWHCVQQFPSFFPNKNTPMILTVHDLNFLLEKDKLKANWYLRKLQKNIDKAQFITTISNFTRLELEKHTDLKGKEVQVIYNGVYKGDPSEMKKPDYITRQKFFFSIGEFKVKKNFHVLLPLMNHFDDYQLIIAGNYNSEYGQNILDEVKRLRLNHKIILPGRINEAEKNWLYKNCHAFLFPSMAEGFGMPAIEAMHAGKPTFLSKETSLPEIGGDKAIYFETFETEYMAEFLKTELNNFYRNQSQRANELIAYSQKFTWEKCAGEYLDLYNKISRY